MNTDTSSQVKERQTAEIPVRQGGNERRRPGRIENISPHLIPLLRHPTGFVEPVPAEDNLRLPKGIAVGVLLAIPLWGLIIGGIMMVIR